MVHPQHAHFHTADLAMDLGCRKHETLQNDLDITPMSAQTVLRSLLAELVDNAAKDRADEAPEAWAALEKFARCYTCPSIPIASQGWP